MMFTKEEVGACIRELEEQEKFAWAELNKILGAKAVYIDIYEKMEKEEAAADKAADTDPEKGD